MYLIKYNIPVFNQIFFICKTETHIQQLVSCLIRLRISFYERETEEIIVIKITNNNRA